MSESTRPIQQQAQEPWAIAVFAHNEERHIVAALESIARGSASHPLRAYILANGCRDNTEAVVREYALSHSWVTLVSIAVGDKSNAWNVFVHDVDWRSDVCFFVDGDISVEPGAFDALYSALTNAPESNAAAAVPATGRNRKILEQYVCEHRLLLGNLYALRGEFVRRARESGARLPVGYIGDDGLVTSLVKWNLEPQGRFIEDRVAPCPQAKFSYRSFSPWSVRDWRTYWRRRIRYSLRHFQHELLVPLLKSMGLAGMPASVKALYRKQAEMVRRCRPRSGLDAIFDRIAIDRMRREL